MSEFELESGESGESGFIPAIKVDPNWTSDFQIITNDYYTLDQVSKVGFLFYTSDINPSNWDDAQSKSRIIYFTKEKEGTFTFDNSSLSVTKSVNNLVLVDKNGLLIGSRKYSIPINLKRIKKLTVYVTVYEKEKEITSTTFEVSFAEHLTDEEANGIESVHPNIFNYASSRSEIRRLYNDMVEGNISEGKSAIEPILEEVSEYTPMRDTLQFIENVPQFFNGIAKKYSYYIWYYLDRNGIKEKIDDIFRRLSLKDETESGESEDYIKFEFRKEFHLGFNERVGSYLYYYDVYENYIVMIIVGSNGNNNIDIYIANNSKMQLDLSLEKYRLKINKWYDKLYFVLPYYINGGYSGRFMFTIYPLSSEVISGNTPVRYDNLEMEVPVGTSGESVRLPYSINVYSPSGLDIGQITVEDFSDSYLTEFSDIGDLLVNVKNLDDGYFEVAYYNIFGQSSNGRATATSTLESIWKPTLLNTYDIDNRQSISCLESFYETTIEQIKYLLHNQYYIYYLGSEYSVGYDSYNNKYLILFKDAEVERVRRSLSEDFRFFAGSYLVFKDHIESIYGETLSDESTFFGTEPSKILCYDRGVVVIEGDTIGAYRR